MNDLQLAVSKQGKFLSSLRSGDIVLVCQKDGEVYGKAEVYGVEPGKAELWHSSFGLSSWNPGRFFSLKTGKQRGGDLFLQPYDEARYQAHVAEMAKLHEEIGQRQQARDTEKRNQLTDNILCLAELHVINRGNLDKYPTRCLEALEKMLDELLNLATPAEVQ